MSCTVFAVPYALAWVVGAVITGAISIHDNQNNYTSTYDTDRIIEEYGRLNNNCDDINIINTQSLIEKTFETPFLDKNLLIKTLEEHGVTEIEENDFGKISGKVDNYNLSFEKQEADKKVARQEKINETAKRRKEKCRRYCSRISFNRADSIVSFISVKKSGINYGE